MHENHELVDKLDADDGAARLGALRELALMYGSGAIERPVTGANVNNHIHTTFSFSPYSPSKAVYLAWRSGLSTAGIMDHDSVGGVTEFVEAGKIIGLPVTVGFELRCSLKGTPFEGRRVNNPDQKSVAYVAMHAIPHRMVGDADMFLAPLREKRNIRNREMVARLNDRLRQFDITLDFDRDVLPFSQYKAGGSVTERHIMYALAAAFTRDELKRYFLLGQFKSQLIESVYIDAEGELAHISEFVAFAERLGAVPAYAYLGDVGVSVTGDKKAQAFEDAYLDELIKYLSEIGIRAVTYMPARNGAGQLDRIKGLCERYGLFQISGEDINSPTQSFICEKIETPEFRHLIDSAWALIGHEAATGDDLAGGLFSKETVARMPGLDERIRHYAAIARARHYRGL